MVFANRSLPTLALVEEHRGVLRDFRGTLSPLYVIASLPLNRTPMREGEGGRRVGHYFRIRLLSRYYP